MRSGLSQPKTRPRSRKSSHLARSESPTEGLLTHYLNDAGTRSRLTPEGVLEIARRIRNGTDRFQRLLLGSVQGAGCLWRDLSAILDGTLDLTEVLDIDGRSGRSVPEEVLLRRWQALLGPFADGRSGTGTTLPSEILNLPYREERLLHYLQELAGKRTERAGTALLLVQLKRLRLRVDMSVQELVEANLLLVVSVARRFRNSGLDLIDLVQEGNIGLIKAARRFDPERGFQFSTYATWWIRQGIQRAILNRGRLVRLPIHQAELVQKVQKEIDLLLSRRENPTPARVAERLQMPLASVRELMLTPTTPVSIDAPVGPEGSQTLQDVVGDPRPDGPDQLCGLALLEAQSERILGRLSKRERQILRRRCGLVGEGESTLLEISRELGISAVRVRQIEAGAMRKLRNPDARPVRDRETSAIRAPDPAQSV